MSAHRFLAEVQVTSPEGVRYTATMPLCLDDDKINAVAVDGICEAIKRMLKVAMGQDCIVLMTIKVSPDR